MFFFALKTSSGDDIEKSGPIKYVGSIYYTVTLSSGLLSTDLFWQNRRKLGGG